MASTTEVIRVLRESFADRARTAPSIDEFGPWLQGRIDGASYLSRSWAPRNAPSFTSEGNAERNPGLLRLTAEQRRDFLFALRPARALRSVATIRTEAVLAGLADSDVPRMYDGLWTYGRLKLAAGLNGASGTDYSLNFFTHLEELAVGDDVLTEDQLPDEAPAARRGHRFSVVAINLFRAIRSGTESDLARDAAQRFVEARSTAVFESLQARYLLAVLDQQSDAAARHLAEIGKKSVSSPWLRQWKEPLDRVASLKLHGLAALGEQVIPGLSEVAAASPAWSAELAVLIKPRQLAAHTSSKPVVSLPGATQSLQAVFRPRPFTDYAAPGGVATA